jgi:hypothetical protein
MFLVYSRGPVSKNKNIINIYYYNRYTLINNTCVVHHFEFYWFRSVHASLDHIVWFYIIPHGILYKATAHNIIWTHDRKFVVIFYNFIIRKVLHILLLYYTVHYNFPHERRHRYIPILYYNNIIRSVAYIVPI